ncbi:hypothetical protein MMPV_005782 [Pyropia vietnamensis]
MAQPMQYPLRIRLLRARHLRRSDWTTGESDPYAEVWLAEGGQKQRTRVASNTRCPLWNHDFSFTLTSGDADTLHVQVFDEDIGKRDELLGEVTIPVSKLMHLVHESPMGAAGSGSTVWADHGLPRGAGVGGYPAPPPWVSAAGHGHPMVGPVCHGANSYPPPPPLPLEVDAYGRPLPPTRIPPPLNAQGWFPSGPAFQPGFTFPPPPARSSWDVAPSSAPCRSASSELSPDESSPKKSSRKALSSSLSGMSLGKMRDSLLAAAARPGTDAVGIPRVHGMPSRPSRHTDGVNRYDTHIFAETPSVHHADTPLLSAPLLAAGYTAEWYPLTPERSGEIAIALVPDERLARRRGGPYRDTPSLPINIPFQVFHASLLTKAACFPTYTLQLHSVRSVFGSIRCRWNKDYPAAQQIFSSNPQAFLARGLIKAQHARLCGGGIALDDGVVSTVRRALAGLTGAIATAPEFFALVHNGIRGGKSRFFTYVLLAGDRAGSARLRFSETGASFFDDARSKHAVHSNAAEEVVYSGEFHIRTHAREAQEALGQAVVTGNRGLPPRPPTLVLDNGSGTYAPSKEHLPLLRQVFQRNFPDMDVQAVDFQGPVVTAAKQDIKDYDII